MAWDASESQIFGWQRRVVVLDASICINGVEDQGLFWLTLDPPNAVHTKTRRRVGSTLNYRAIQDLDIIRRSP